jgi:predicted metal-dependent phosphoesterase TrpH
VRADLHCHSAVSKDSLSSRDAVLGACARKGIDCLALTDHNRLTLWKSDTVRLIPAEEIMTSGGEIIGLFLAREIPAGLTPTETVKRIKDQGALVYVPHPFDHFRRSSRLKPEALAQIAPFVDAVEGLNARNLWPVDDKRAQAWASDRGLPCGAGSDAHTPGEVGTACVELAPFATPREFLQSLRQGRLRGGNSPFWVHGFSTWAKWQKRS